MNANEWELVSELFMSALEVETCKRDAFIETSTSDAPWLKEQVKLLLRGHSKIELCPTSSLLPGLLAPQFDLRSGNGCAPTPSAHHEAGNSPFSGFEIISVLGQGAFGQVYLVSIRIWRYLMGSYPIKYRQKKFFYSRP